MKSKLVILALVLLQIISTLILLRFIVFASRLSGTVIKRTEIRQRVVSEHRVLHQHSYLLYVGKPALAFNVPAKSYHNLLVGDKVNLLLENPVTSQQRLSYDTAMFLFCLISVICFVFLLFFPVK